MLTRAGRKIIEDRYRTSPKGIATKQKWINLNRDKLRASVNRYSISLKGKATRRRWALRNRDKTRANWRRYHLTPKGKATQQNWRVRNPDKIREWHRLWAVSSNGRASARKWYRKSPLAMFLLYKHASLKRGLTFDLTRDRFVEMIQRPCKYCGSEPTEETRRNGLDRVNNERGYIRSNVVPCCFACNQMKGKRTVSDFIEHIRKIFIHQEKRSYASK